MTESSSSPRAALSNLQIYVVCVAIWGSTWLAITFQLGKVEPEASVFYRFLLASVLLFGWCLARGHSLALSRRQHLVVALQGIFLFSVSYMFVYHAESHLVSGLVAVGYSASPLLNMLGVRIAYGTPMKARVIAGSLLGMAGIALVFWPEIASLSVDRNVMLGAWFTALSVVASAIGSVLAVQNRKLALPVWQAMAWGMLYGALFSLAVCMATGKSLHVETTIPYGASLLYLSVFGSVIAFACYLTLLARIGAARAGYIGVIVPVVALVLSAFFEGFKWHAETGLGIALSLAGNVIILRRGGGADDAGH